MDCLTAMNNTLALRYRGDHDLSAEMLQFSGFRRVNDVGNYGACARLAAQARFCVVQLLQAGALVTGTQGLCLPTECTADDLHSITSTLKPLRNRFHSTRFVFCLFVCFVIICFVVLIC